MCIESNAKESFLEWMRSAKLRLGVISCLEQFGIKEPRDLKLVDNNVFVCVTKKPERYVLRIQTDREKAQVWVDNNGGARRYFLVENGIIQRA